MVKTYLSAGLLALAASSSALSEHHLERDEFRPHGEPYEDFRWSQPPSAVDHPRDRPRDVSAVHYDLDIKASPDTGIIEGTAMVLVRADRDGVESLALDAEDLEIMLVADHNTGEALHYSYAENLLIVDLKRRLDFGDIEMVDITYRARNSQSYFLTGPDATNPQRMVAGYTYSQPEGAKTWFPSIDFPDQKATATMRVRTPKPHRPLTNGPLIWEKDLGDSYELFYRMDKPMAPYLFSLAIGAFDVVTIGEFRGYPLTLWTPPAIREQAVAATAKTEEIMEVLSDFVGVDYPFGPYAQSVAQAWQSSMEHQGATTMGGWRITGDGTGIGVVTHELAHQWFGDHVTCGNWSELWLNEGFASFLPQIYFSRRGYADRAMDYEDYWRSGYFSEAKSKVRPLSTQVADYDDFFDSHAYEKGALVIKWLRHLVNELPAIEPGTENFTLVLRDYLTAHGGGAVSHSDLRDSAERVTGRSWRKFFTQWVETAGHPTVEYSWRQSGNRLTLNLRQVQAFFDKPWPAFQFSLPVEILGPNGQRVVTRVEVYEATHEFEIPISFRPVAVALDPDWLLPMEWASLRGEREYLAVARLSPAVRSRLNAYRALFAEYPRASSEVRALIRGERSGYVLMNVGNLLQASLENRAVVEEVRRQLLNVPNPSLYVGATPLALERWLVETSDEDPAPTQAAAWEEQYFLAETSMARRDFLFMVKRYSIERAHAFALGRLAEPQWTTRDRAYLIDILTKFPAASSEDFIKSTVTRSTYNYFKRIVQNLAAAGYRSEDLVPILIAQLQEHRYEGGRGAVAELLAIQTQAKDQVCSALQPILGGSSAEKSPWVRSKVAAAAKSLGCGG